jgi:hypothetical protein
MGGLFAWPATAVTNTLDDVRRLPNETKLGCHHAPGDSASGVAQEPQRDRAGPTASNPLSFPKIPSKRIRANMGIIA